MLITAAPAAKQVSSLGGVATSFKCQLDRLASMRLARGLTSPICFLS